MAMDKLLSADRQLRLAVEQRLGVADADRWSLARLARGIHIFSDDVRLLREDKQGDRAVVTFQIADRVPLERARFEKHEDRWLLQVDRPIPGLADVLSDLADAVVRLADRVRDVPMSLEQIDAEWRSRVRPYEQRLRRILEAYAKGTRDSASRANEAP